MDIFSLISEKVDINLNIHKVLIELEMLDKEWRAGDIPLDEHKYGRIPREKDIKMWSIPRSSMKIITLLAIANHAKVILDIGTSAGYSAIWLSVAAKINKGHVWATEIFEPKAKMAEHFFQEAGVEEYITLYHGDIEAFFNKWNSKKQIDFILFDADKENHLKYLKQCEKFINEGGIIVVDNASNFRGLMADLLAYFDKSSNFITTVFDFDNGILAAIKKNLDNFNS